MGGGFNEAELEVDELDIGGLEFGEGGLGEIGVQLGFEDELFREVMVTGAIGLGVVVGERDGGGGEAGDLRLGEADEWGGIAGG